MLSCEEEPKESTKVLATRTIPVPPDWQAAFQGATSKTVSDTMQFPKRGTVTITAELLQKGKDTAFIQKITVTQNSVANGTTFSASLAGDPVNTSEGQSMSMDFDGDVQVEKNSAGKYEMNSRAFYVHSLSGIEKK